MIFYFLYEVLIKKYNIRLLKEIFDNPENNIIKDYNLEEIIIKYPNIYNNTKKPNRILLTPIYEENEFGIYNELEMIV